MSEIPGIIAVPPRDEEFCDDNLAPIIIMVVTIFVGLILLPISWYADIESDKEFSKRTDDGYKSNVEKPRKTPKEKTKKYKRPEDSASDPQLDSDPEIIVELRNQVDSENGSSPMQSDVEYEAVDITPKMKTVEPKKSCCQELFEGHLTFGLILYRSDLSRWLRVLVLFIVLLWQLLVEGLLFYAFEDFDQGSEKATQTMFDDYTGNYFGYTILAIVISVPVEVYFILLFTLEKTKKSSNCSNTGFVIGMISYFVILAAVIVGVVLLYYQFCHEWSGYWSISWLWSILLEIFVCETIYMLVRYGWISCRKQA